MTEKESHHDMKQTRKQGEHGSDQAVETHKHYVGRKLEQSNTMIQLVLIFELLGGI
jgi:hypothetical protein